MSLSVALLFCLSLSVLLVNIFVWCFVVGVLLLVFVVVVLVVVVVVIIFGGGGGGGSAAGGDVEVLSMVSKSIIKTTRSVTHDVYCTAMDDHLVSFNSF